MSISYTKSIWGIEVASGELDVSRFADVVTLGYATRKAVRCLEESGCDVYQDDDDEED